MRRTLIWVAATAVVLTGLSISQPGLAAEAALLPLEQCKPIAPAMRPGGTPDLVQIDFGPRDNRLASRGTIRVSTIMVDFSDAAGGRSSTEYYRSFVPAGLDILRNFSHGELTIVEERSSSWIRMPRPSTGYNYYRGMTDRDHLRFIQDAVDAADSAMDFSATDALIVVMPPTLTTPGYDVSPAFVNVPGRGIMADGNEILNATTIGTDWADKRSFVLAHELLHTMGLVDLYDLEGTWEGDPYVQRFVGPFSLMGYYASNPEIFAWERWVLGWLGDTDALCLDKGTHDVSLRGVSLAGSGTRIAVIPLGGTRFLSLEARTRAGLDSRGAEGVLPYVVDPAALTGSGPIRVPSTGPRTVMAPLVPGQTRIVEGVGLEILSRDGSGYAVRVHTTAPPMTLPGKVGSLRVERNLGAVLATWQEPLNTGWTPVTGYEYRIGKGSWITAKTSSVPLKGFKRGQLITVDVRARNAVGLGPINTVQVRLR